MKNFILYSVIAILAFIVIFTNFNDSFEPTDFSDTIRVVKPFIPKEIKKPTTPELTIIYPQDTMLRKEIETGTVIINVEKKKQTLSISKIDTKGLIIENKYDLPIFSSYVIDTSGNVKIKRRFWPYIIAGTTIVVFSLIGIKKVMKSGKGGE